jgi:hypothetical protein
MCLAIRPGVHNLSRCDPFLLRVATPHPRLAWWVRVAEHC